MGDSGPHLAWPAMIEATELTKRYGDKTAVDGLSFTVRPGVVTGFLGPNGAGKSTTMRMILGLDAPSAGQVTVDGRPLPRPAGAAASGRRAAGGALDPPGPLGHQPPAGARPDARHPAPARRRGDRPGRPAPGRAQARRHVLARHGPAARDRLRAARRPDHARARRAGQRPRPRGHPLDAQPAARARRRGPHDLRVLASDERDGADRRPPDRRGTRAAAGRHADGGLRRAGVAGGRARALAARHAAARAAARRRRDGQQRRAGRAGGRRAEHRGDRRPRARPKGSRCTSCPRATRRSRTRSWS